MTLTFGSLFTGIGGFDLGFERAGMECRWHVENDTFCQRVLAKHWPDAGRWDDVRTFPPSPYEDWEVDLICGGFPCQGISSANHNGKGLQDERSGLWFEYLRISRVLRPEIIVVENTAAITFRGLRRVLSDLSESGFDAEWQTLPAQDFGAPHGRDRLFIVAYPNGKRLSADGLFVGGPFETASEKQEDRLRVWPGLRESRPALPDRIRWCPDSQLCRVADGFPDELDRYRVLGNAVVPIIAEWIGRRIMESITLKGL